MPPGGRVSDVSSTGTNCQMPFRQNCSRRELMTSSGSSPQGSFSWEGNTASDTFPSSPAASRPAAIARARRGRRATARTPLSPRRFSRHFLLVIPQPHPVIGENQANGKMVVIR